MYDPHNIKRDEAMTAVAATIRGVPDVLLEESMVEWYQEMLGDSPQLTPSVFIWETNRAMSIMIPCDIPKNIVIPLIEEAFAGYRARKKDDGYCI
jgi:hypothetical protein